MRRTAVAALATSALLATACGSRVPEVTFDQIAAGEIAAEDGLGTAPGGEGEFGAPGGEGDATSGGGFEPVDGGGTGGAGGTTGNGGTAGGAGGGGTGGSGGGTGGSGGSGGNGGSGGSGGSGGGGGGQNQASDVGVTEKEIKVGIIFSQGGPLGPEVFSPPYYGANAYFTWRNQSGGVHGRAVKVIPCDDAEDPGRNRACVDRLINKEKVFALVASSTRAYAGAEDVSEAGVPDIGGQPIGNEYWTYPTFFTIRGAEYPRNGSVGYEGRLYGQTTQFRWAKENAGITHVGAVYYDIPVSASYGQFQVKGAKAEGLKATHYRVNSAFPNFDTVVAQMQSDGVDAIWDTMDFVGNQKLCQAMERKNFRVKLKMTTSQGMTRKSRDFAKVCQDVLHSWNETRPAVDTSHEDVATFRRTIRQLYGEDYERDLHQWAFEGWAAGKLLTHAVERMGPAPTRKGVMDYLESFPSMHDADRPLSETFQLGGALTPTDYQPLDFSKVKTGRECLVISKWNPKQQEFMPATSIPYCQSKVPFIAYEPAR